MANYLGSHKTNILEEISVPSWRNIKRGDIISARYKNLEGKSELKIYLVLHTYWPKTDRPAKRKGRLPLSRRTCMRGKGMPQFVPNLSVYSPFSMQEGTPAHEGAT